MHLSSGQETSLFLVQLLTLLVLWTSWKELKEQAWFITCPEKCAEELCPKCLLVLWTMNSHLSHRQNNLSHPALTYFSLLTKETLIQREKNNTKKHKHSSTAYMYNTVPSCVN